MYVLLEFWRDHTSYHTLHLGMEFKKRENNKTTVMQHEEE